jgi:hypothetical protein
MAKTRKKEWTFNEQQDSLLKKVIRMMLIVNADNQKLRRLAHKMMDKLDLLIAKTPERLVSSVADRPRRKPTRKKKPH